MITAIVYWMMKFQFGANWSYWSLVLPVITDLVIIAALAKWSAHP
ncbi:hypothetical protein ACET6W_17125 [Aeromonas veronii]